MFPKWHEKHHCSSDTCWQRVHGDVGGNEEKRKTKKELKELIKAESRAGQSSVYGESILFFADAVHKNQVIGSIKMNFQKQVSLYVFLNPSALKEFNKHPTCLVGWCRQVSAMGRPACILRDCRAFTKSVFAQYPPPKCFQV